jgi:phosphatidate cytidylyltransferase
MKRVATAAVLVPVILLIVLKAPTWLFALTVGLVALIASREYLAIAGHYVPVYSKATIAFVLLVWLLILAAYFCDFRLEVVFIAAPILFALLLLAVGMRKEELAQSLPAAALSFVTVIYVVVPLGALILIRELELGRFFVLFLFIAVWSGDIAAFYVGRSLGRHKLAPRISPNKSWEGSVASTIFSVVVAVLYVHFANMQFGRMNSYGEVPSSPHYVMTIGITVLINLAAQVGDLVESMLKRGAGIKDSGTVLPGHGGVLDRIDALLFATPIAMLLFGFAAPYFSNHP